MSGLISSHYQRWSDVACDNLKRTYHSCYVFQMGQTEKSYKKGMIQVVNASTKCACKLLNLQCIQFYRECKSSHISTFTVWIFLLAPN